MSSSSKDASAPEYVMGIPDFKQEFTGFPSSIAGDNLSFFQSIVSDIPVECTFTRMIAKVYSVGGFDGFIGKDSLLSVCDTLRRLAKYETEVLELTKGLREKLAAEPEWKPTQGVIDVDYMGAAVTFRSIPLSVVLEHDIDYRKIDMIRHHVPQLFPLKKVDHREYFES